MSNALTNRNRFGRAALAAVSILSLAAASSAPGARAHRADVTLIRTPGGGIQPQLAVDENGVLHLIYFKGDPSAGDVYYVMLTSTSI